MLEQLFTAVIEISLAASFIVLVIVGIRALLQNKLPKLFSYALWAIVLIRLLVPVTPASSFSLFNLLPANTPAAIIENTIGFPAPVPSTSEQTGTDVQPGNSANSEITLRPPDDLVPTASTSETPAYPTQLLLSVLSWLWISGVLTLFAIGAFAYIRTANKLRTAVLFPLENLLPELQSLIKLKRRIPVFTSDRIDTPFVSGFVKPRIILPLSLAQNSSDTGLRHILIHELVHIKRLDHWTKPLSVLALCIHWFNPFVWLSFVLAQKDRETSCDEKVLACAKSDIKSSYATLLIETASRQHSLFNSGLLAFGECSIKSRVKSIMRYKKANAGKYAVMYGVLLSACILLLTNANILTASNSNQEEAILSTTPVSLTRDGEAYKLVVSMTDGSYAEETEPGPFMGPNWEGRFALKLLDERNNVVAELDLNEAFGEQSLNFQSLFDIAFDDYNNDGNQDFTIGQYASSNGNVFKLFTITPDGQLQYLPIQDQGLLFSSGGNRYSKHFDKTAPAAFTNTYYDNRLGSTIETMYEWSESEQQFVKKQAEL